MRLYYLRGNMKNEFRIELAPEQGRRMVEEEQESLHTDHAGHG